MDIAWIQVFVLSISECVAPAGKTVCQESQFELQFLSQSDCEFALEQLVTLKSESEKVIIDPSGAVCTPTAKQQEVFTNLDQVNAAAGKPDDWRAPSGAEAQSAPVPAALRDRLSSLSTCAETDGVAPCKIGDIIIETATQPKAVDVWQRDD